MGQVGEAGLAVAPGPSYADAWPFLELLFNPEIDSASLTQHLFAESDFGQVMSRRKFDAIRKCVSPECSCTPPRPPLWLRCAVSVAVCSTAVGRHAPMDTVRSLLPFGCCISDCLQASES